MKKTISFLLALLMLLSVLPVNALAAETEQPTANVTRISGTTDSETARMVADALKAELGVEKFDAIVYAYGYNFPDALTAPYLAVVKQAPFLIFMNDEDANLAYIQENLAASGTVYIIGGEGLIPKTVTTALTEMGIHYERISAHTRFLTNIEILKTAGFDGGKIFVCDGMSFVEAFSAAATGYPVLLTYGKNLKYVEETHDEFLSAYKGKCSFVILGNTDTISVETEEFLRNYGNVSRFSANTTCEISAMVAETYFNNPEEVIFASSQKFRGALCGAPLAYAKNVPLVLTGDGEITAARNYVQNTGISGGTVLGGTDLISDKAVELIFDPDVQHVFGDWVTVKEATCTENGTRERICTMCAEKETESITATGHTEVEDAAVAPSCTETGLTKGKHCSVCKAILSKQDIVEALGHDYQSDGQNQVCSRCGDIYWPDVVYEGICGENAEWKLLKDGRLIIQGTGEMYVYSHAENDAPWYPYQKDIKELVVMDGITQISGFANCENLVNVSLAESITRIDTGAFYGCSSLREISIPISVKEIGKNILAQCVNLKNVTAPGIVFYKDKSYPYYDKDSFPGCENIESVKMLNGSLGAGQFEDWDSLKQITLPEYVGVIYDNTFKDCDNLTEIFIPTSHIGMGRWVFAGCDNLERVTFADDYQEFDGTMMHMIPNLGDGAFQDCVSLREIKFLGCPHRIEGEPFRNVTATAYYPANNKSWTTEAMKAYGGNITWVPYDPNGTHEHSYTPKTIPPTCTEDGYDLYTCSCGDSYKEKYIAAIGHDYASADGQTFICKHCGDEFSMQKTLDELQQKLEDGTLTPEDVQEVVDTLMDIAWEYWMNQIFGNSQTTDMISQVESMMTTTSDVTVEGDIAQVMSAEEVSVVGAKLNSEENVTLAISDAEGTVAIPEGYNESTAVTFSMDLEGVDNSEQLDVPVQITLPVPETMDAEKVAILHYEDNNTVSEVIDPAISEDGSEASFVVTSFSNFAMVEQLTYIPITDNVNRIFGSGRCETARKVADAMKEELGIEKFDAILYTSAMNFADALAGSYLSAVKNAPILLYLENSTDPQANLEYIQNNLAAGGTVYILGGNSAVPESVDDTLAELGINAQRVAGTQRFQTNIEILKASGFSGNSTVLVCTAMNFADSLSASASGLPILLVYDKWTELSDEYKDYLKDFNGLNFVVVGGKNAVSEALETSLSAYGTVEERLAGATRYETSTMVAEKFFQNPESAVLAYAMNFPDGLCGGALAYAKGSPLILTNTGATAKAESYVQGKGITTGTVLGGEGLISNEAAEEVFAVNGESTTPGDDWGGGDF